jgi:hypothetical protein
VQWRRLSLKGKVLCTFRRFICGFICDCYVEIGRWFTFGTLSRMLRLLEKVESAVLENDHIYYCLFFMHISA